jgi:hypothetical protein
MYTNCLFGSIAGLELLWQPEHVTVCVQICVPVLASMAYSLPPKVEKKSRSRVPLAVVTPVRRTGAPSTLSEAANEKICLRPLTFDVVSVVSLGLLPVFSSSNENWSQSLGVAALTEDKWENKVHRPARRIPANAETTIRVHLARLLFIPILTFIEE